ncbi:MAG: DMP19 family protein [Mucilaginibacter sp.]
MKILCRNNVNLRNLPHKKHLFSMSLNINKPDLDQLIASENLNNSIIELDNYICKLGDWGNNLTALSYPQIAFYFNQELEREVNNGGFDQYFSNSSGMYADETIKTLKLIGADKTAKILEAAIEPFPNKTVPVDRDLRQQILDKIRENSEALWEVLTEQFFLYEDDLNQLNMDFVKKNKEHF